MSKVVKKMFSIDTELSLSVLSSIGSVPRQYTGGQISQQLVS